MKAFHVLVTGMNFFVALKRIQKRQDNRFLEKVTPPSNLVGMFTQIQFAFKPTVNYGCRNNLRGFILKTQRNITSHHHSVLV